MRAGVGPGARRGRAVSLASLEAGVPGAPSPLPTVCLLAGLAEREVCARAAGEQTRDRGVCCGAAGPHGRSGTAAAQAGPACLACHVRAWVPPGLPGWQPLCPRAKVVLSSSCELVWGRDGDARKLRRVSQLRSRFVGPVHETCLPLCFLSFDVPATSFLFAFPFRRQT